MSNNPPPSESLRPLSYPMHAYSSASFENRVCTTCCIIKPALLSAFQAVRSVASNRKSRLLRVLNAFSRARLLSTLLNAALQTLRCSITIASGFYIRLVPRALSIILTACKLEQVATLALHFNIIQVACLLCIISTARSVL